MSTTKDIETIRRTLWGENENAKEALERLAASHEGLLVSLNAILTTYDEHSIIISSDIARARTAIAAATPNSELPSPHSMRGIFKDAKEGSAP